MKTLKDIIVIIPAYNPDDTMTNLVNELIEEKIENIIIVNDGSRLECEDLFHSLSNSKECTVLKHAVNLGKGRALKTSFNYVLNHFPECIGVVTVDADGQHATDDILEIIKTLQNRSDDMVLGVRDFSKAQIPFRSRFGNILTRNIYRFASGIKLSDTQTGLRGIPAHFMRILMNVDGERYEFEMNMLLESKTNNIPIVEKSIKTIYLDANISSKFRPVIDSIKIYTILLRFMFSSLASFLVDIGIFVLVTYLFKDISPKYFVSIASISSRVLSSVFNYTLNRKAVFKNKSSISIRHSSRRYFILSIFQMLVSTFAVQAIYFIISGWEVVIKIVVDALLFLFSFTIQREWVFKKK